MESSFRRLRYFLHVCDTLHIGRAAEQLGIAQPALSLQIKTLEQELGVRLFIRRKRGIELSVAGAAYKASVERLLADHLDAAELAKRTARGESGALRIGYVGSALFEPEFPQMLRQMRKQYPLIQLGLRELQVEEQLSALQAGEIDIGVVRPPTPSISAKQRHMPFSHRPLVAAIPAGHALLKAQSVSIKALSKEAYIDLADPPHIGITRLINDLCEKAQTHMQVAWRVTEVASILGLVAAGMGVGVVPAAVAKLAMPSVKFRPVRDAGAVSELRLVWLDEKINPALISFVKLAEHFRFRKH